jgi:hypothetical protein
MPAPPRTIILSDEAFIQLAGRGDVLGQFPFLRMRSLKVRGCGRCAASATRQFMQGECNRVKLTLLNMPVETKAAFKRFLNTDLVVLYAPTPKGIQKVTF